MTITKNKILAFKNRLLSFNDNESLSKMSLVVIFALDIFVIYMIFAGLHDHTSLLTSHYEYMPGVCREAIIEQSWTNENRIDKLQETLLAKDNSTRYNSYNFLNSSEVEKTHPVCKGVLTKINIIREKRELLGVFRERQATQERQNKLTEEFRISKDVYDTNLLESITAERKSTEVLSVENSSKELSYELNNINQSMRGYNLTLSNAPSVIEFWNYLDGLPSQKHQVVHDLKQFDFWYPIKVLAWQFIFLLPLCGLFYFWNDRSIKKNNDIQVLLSSHLLVVSFVPILFKLLELILDLLPHRILETVFNLLNSLNIIAIWHYLVILLAVISALFAIYIIQKKLFSKEKIMGKRLLKGACYECGKKLPCQSHHICPFCGTEQKRQCSTCKENTYIAGEYCINCGSSNW